MAIEIIDVDDGLGNLILMTGAISEREFVDGMRAHLSQDPEKYRKYRFSLTDLSRATELNISSAIIEQHAHACLRSAEINPDVVIAIVAPQTLGFGLSRMWEILSSETSWEVQVFKDGEKARNWIAQRAKDRWNIIDLTMGYTGRQ